LDKKHFQVIVIGSGPGGYAAAFRASDLGKKVLLVDRDANLGGVCLNRGCIPSKSLLHISKIIQEAYKLEKAGVSFGEPVIDLKKVRDHKNNIVKKLNVGIGQMAKARGVKTIQGNASFKTNNEITIEMETSSMLVTFDNCIIAAGSASANLPFLKKEHPKIFTSKTALDLKEIPESMLVVGGGIIGLELGQVYSSLGAKVDLVEFLPDLVSGADRDLIKPLENDLKKQFRSIMTSTKVLDIDTSFNDKILVVLENKSTKQKKAYKSVLLAVGRKPNLKTIKIKNTDLKTNKEGFIRVDEQQRTNIENIFAIGDIAGNPMLAHKATHEGKVAAEVICGLPSAFDKRAIPSVIYTEPEVAWVGTTENEAKKKGIEYDKTEFPWAASGRAISIGSVKGKTKLLFNKNTKRIIGGGVVGAGAGDLITEITLGLELGADAEDIGLTIHPHPTTSETVSGAAEVLEGTITDLYFPKK
tara:strand:- start:919 stop:2334 length:1416 start_codon:yes stop_codon:yes gene_type:complete